MNLFEYKYSYSIIWLKEDNEYIGLCAEFPSLSWLAPTAKEASIGIIDLVQETINDITNDIKEL